jgi:hypothetical protein
MDDKSKIFEQRPLSDYILSSAQDSSCLDPNSDIFSAPHSNSFIDLNGDCMPDIFVQKQREISTGTYPVYHNYYEIYVQKLFNDKQMYCLKQTDMVLTPQMGGGYAAGSQENIPLIDFTDIDRDGMIDMVFFHNKSIYVYYNLHQHLQIKSSYSESPNLCKKWDETDTAPIFANFTSAL